MSSTTITSLVNVATGVLIAYVAYRLGRADQQVGSATPKSDPHPSRAWDVATDSAAPERPAVNPERDWTGCPPLPEQHHGGVLLSPAGSAHAEQRRGEHFDPFWITVFPAPDGSLFLHRDDAQRAGVFPARTPGWDD